MKFLLCMMHRLLTLNKYKGCEIPLQKLKKNNINDHQP